MMWNNLIDLKACTCKELKSVVYVLAVWSYWWRQHDEIKAPQIRDMIEFGYKVAGIGQSKQADPMYNDV